MKTNELPKINLSEIMEGMPHGMAYAELVFNHLNEPRDFIFLGMNQAFEQVIGLNKKALIGKNASELIIKQNRKTTDFSSFLFHTMIMERKYLTEFYTTRSQKWYRITAFTFGNIFLGIMLHDITEQKGLEAQMKGYQSHLENLLVGSDQNPISLQHSNLKEASIQKLRYLTFHDKLTGLYNRAFFEEEMARLDTERHLPLSIMMGDVNGLKLTNDTFGHEAGDRLLKNVASILKKSFREKEIIARWGGDEFSVLLPGTTYENALKLLNRVKETCTGAGDDPIKPSIALGVATKTDRGQDLFGVIKDAEDHMYSSKLFEEKIVRTSILDSFEKIIYHKNPFMMEHCTRVGLLCTKFGSYLNLSANEQDALNKLSWFHDIGMVRISEDTIKKPVPLSPKEWLEIRKHPEYGYRIAQLIPEITFISELILSHHENWDGSGYPLKLKGKRIPQLARIFFLVDSYDVITHDRPFKTALSHEEAVDELARRAGTQFDPHASMDFINFMHS
ncbi:diguanylate cyclase [Candidatus Formimonas warabiya]|uniref:Diguanylate cyclase n=1 Tax=Formimonas warabiya TaxID=1761012 RepID=A0A3G1KMM4_FORW1|nr:diguanylate cyclase [Candidatus Formimonas warabiya]ATW23712.1 hypothetical protein DCMF_01910 [Candidatus Formimonas warabiya]